MPDKKKAKPGEDIRQLVQKEVEAALLPLGKIIAGLVEKELVVLKKTVGKAKTPAPKPEKEKAPRIKPADIAKLRKKWKLNRTMFGDLFGVSCEEVKSWERGEHAPAQKTAALILHVGGMSKKERNALVESVAAEVEAAVSDTALDDLK